MILSPLRFTGDGDKLPFINDPSVTQPVYRTGATFQWRVFYKPEGSCCLNKYTHLPVSLFRQNSFMGLTLGFDAS
jgi:hypothetical protein